MCLAEPVFPCNCDDLASPMDGTLPLWGGTIRRGRKVRQHPAASDHRSLYPNGG